MSREKFEICLKKLFEYVDNCPKEKLIQIKTINGFVKPYKNMDNYSDKQI